MYKIYYAVAFLLLLSGILLHCGCNIPEGAIYASNLQLEPETLPSPPGLDEQIRKELEELQKVKTDTYKIAVGDRFSFKVYDNEELNVLGLLVMPDGGVSVGLIGVVNIAGMTISEAQAMIDQKLKKYIRDPHCSLIPTEISSSTYTVIGKIGNPNRYAITKLTRLTDALAIAKGFPTGEFDGKTVELADLDNAFVARNGKILPVNFIEAVTRGNPLHNIPILDGDYIYVPSSANSEIFIIGDVGVPTHLGYQKGMTIVTAMTYAKGLLESSSSNILVVRGNLAANPKVYVIDIHDVMRGMKRDFPLKPNDIIFAPRGAFSQYNTVIRKIMPTFELLNLMAGPFGNSAMTISTPSSSSSGGN